MPTLACPICAARLTYTSVSEIPCRPFCGPRCQRIDLGRWLNEEYRIREALPDAEDLRDPEDEPPP